MSVVVRYFGSRRVIARGRNPVKRGSGRHGVDERTPVEISRFIDERGLTLFQVGMLLWSTLFALVDGYALATFSSAMPGLKSAWEISFSALSWVSYAVDVAA